MYDRNCRTYLIGGKGNNTIPEVVNSSSFFFLFKSSFPFFVYIDFNSSSKIEIVNLIAIYASKAVLSRSQGKAGVGPRNEDHHRCAMLLRSWTVSLPMSPQKQPPCQRWVDGRLTCICTAFRCIFLEIEIPVDMV